MQSLEKLQSTLYQPMGQLGIHNKQMWKVTD